MYKFNGLFNVLMNNKIQKVNSADGGFKIGNNTLSCVTRTMLFLR